MKRKTKPHIKELFESPNKELISKGLSELFCEEQVRHTRAGRAGMEVGNARERVLIALCMHLFDNSNVKLPPTTAEEEDLSIAGNPISIKSKTGSGNSGIKIKWTTDWSKADEIRENYTPSCDILLVKIEWGATSGLYWIPLAVQKEIFNKLGKGRYIKVPPQGTNPRGVEFSTEAIKLMLASPSTMKIMIDWDTPDPSLEKKIYEEYVAKWAKIAAGIKI